MSILGILDPPPSDPNVKLAKRVAELESRADRSAVVSGGGLPGPPGATGATGATGAAGPTGPAGSNGNTVWSGAGAPGAGLGVNGDFYIDTTNSRIYGPKAAGAWPGGFTSIIGPTGSTGPAGTNGTDGKTVRSGSGAPAGGLGVDGDFYINTAAWTIYGPKTAGAWGSATSLVGPTGPAGTNGTNGNTILNGSGVPSAGLGVNGDFYINTAANTIYGPKTAGAWGSAVSIVGPTGSTGGTGPTGPAGAAVLNGAGAPTAGIGVNGDFYIDTTNTRLYGPKAAGAWPGTYTSLIGPAGTGGGVAVITNAPILDVGATNNRHAGRTFAATDFTTDLSLNTPVGIYNLSDLTDASGSARVLVNKGAAAFGKGVTGAATEALWLTGGNTSLLYRSDTGASDPFRLKWGSWGCWFRTCKRGADQFLVSKMDATNYSYKLAISTSNVIQGGVGTGGAAWATSPTGTTDVCDGRWHFAVVTYDGGRMYVYVDGNLETAGTTSQGTITQAGAGPLNIGAGFGDVSVVGQFMHNGQIDSAFVTPDVLSQEHVRILGAQKIAHTLGSIPKTISVNARRKARGGVLASADYPTAPKHLYNLDNLNDLGSLNNALTAVNTPVQGPGPDGQNNGAYIFASGSSQSLTGTDTGLPTTGARTIGCWYRTTGTGITAFGYGTWSGDSAFGIHVNVSGQVALTTFGTNRVTHGTATNDGSWHFVAATYDPAPVDLLKYKLFVDGVLRDAQVGAAATTVLSGAAGVKVANGAAFWNGGVARGFVTDYAMDPADIMALYAKGGGQHGIAPSVDDMDFQQVIAHMDASSVFLGADCWRRQGAGNSPNFARLPVPSQYALDISVA